MIKNNLIKRIINRLTEEVPPPPPEDDPFEADPFEPDPGTPPLNRNGDPLGLDTMEIKLEVSCDFIFVVN